jgi:hypothetical protein
MPFILLSLVLLNVFLMIMLLPQRCIARVEHLKSDSLGYAQALIAMQTLRLDWKGLPGRNTGLLQTFVNYERKSLIIPLGPGCILPPGDRNYRLMFPNYFKISWPVLWP